MLAGSTESEQCGKGAFPSGARGENYQRPFPIDSAKVKPATINSVEPVTYVLLDGKQVRKSNEAT